ncbi:MAG: LysR family transcriptional regulator [Alphaproteobacteria bacterium]|nr:LysR family transcriptional regulator [Alphaproteobacteria bacterium]
MLNVEPFVHTAELASFSAAARRLGVSPAAISKAVARLEEELGVQLLERTSRRVGLTAEGEVWLEHCRVALDALQAGRDRIQASSGAVRGEVRITASPVLGMRVGAALGRLLDRHPELDVTCTFTDDYLSLAADEADLAVRMGSLDDSALVARRLATCRWVTVAAPAYLARAPELKRPADLVAHRCLKFLGPHGRVTEWDLDGVAVPTSLRIGDGNALVQAAVAGVGVIRVFDFVADEAVREGRLVPVLERWEGEGPAIHLVCRAGRQDVPRLRVVIDHLVEAFRVEPFRAAR